MLKKLTLASLFSVFILSLTGCQDVEKVASKAGEAISHRNYRGALKTLLELPDRTIEKNDSLFLMLSEAYYGLNNSFANIDAKAICDMDVTPDGKSILFTDLRTGRVIEYSYPELKLNRVINASSPIYGIDFSEDGSKFAAALSNSNVDLFDFNSGTSIKSLSGHTNRVRTVAYLDSTHLVSGGNDQYVITWDIPEAKILSHQWPHRKNVKSLKKSKDGNYLLSTSNDGTAIIWDYTDKGYGKEFRKMTHGRNYVNDGAISPDNKFVVTVSGDGDAKVWDARLGTLQETIPLEDAGCSVEFSPDGKYIAVGGYSFVHLINTERWTVEEKIPIFNDAVWCINFVDGNKIIFADSSHFGEFELLPRQELIAAARKWLKEHRDL